MVNDYNQISYDMNQSKNTTTGETLNNEQKNLTQNETQNEQILPTQQINQEQNNVAQNGNMEQILPVQNYVYEKSENTKIDNLRKDANKYFDNSEKTKNYINMLEKIIQDKDIDIRINNNLTDNQGNIANGKYENGVITINPNSDRAGEFITVHELTHAIGTDSMRNIIENYRKSNIEFDNAVKSLLNNYNTTELTDEAMADVSAQLFGNQEYINNLAQENPNLFKRIYNEIKYLWHQFGGYKNQNEFIEDLQYKWEQAYRNNNELNDTTNFSIAGRKGLENLKNNSNIYNKGISRYTQAVQLANQNVDNEQIRQKTGWFQDKNNDWKFEISDKDMNIKNNIKLNKNGEYELSKIIEHNTLFNIYPELEKLKVTFKDTKKIGGNYNNKSIILSNDLLSNNKKIEKTLIHEIQHAIQEIEGFETGITSKLSKKTYYENLGEIEADDVSKRFVDEKYNNKNINNIAPESSKTNPKHRNYDNYMKNRSNVDKIKDNVFKYAKRGGNSDSINQENMEQIDGKTLQDSDKEIWNRLDNENSKESSFSMDNKGRKLSKEQQEYFKDSKVRDENGNLLIMYHGTPNGNYNEFNEGTYFTSRKEYADGYQNPNASMLTTKQDSSNPKTYEVYLNIKNPFSIQDERAKRIYLDEYVKGGNSLYLDPYTDYSDYINALDELDWTEGEDLREWLKENHPEYDGLVLDEGGDGGYGEAEYKWRGKSYVPFNSNQIKNVDNLNPTDNPDIRYSKNNQEWQEYLDENIETKGTKTNLQEIALPTKQNVLPVKESKSVASEKVQNNKTENEVNLPTKGETIDWGEMEKPEGKIRKHYRSIIESSNTTAEAKEIAKEMMGLDTYTPQSNESLLQRADSRINTTNPETELNSLLSRVMNNEKINDVDMAVGERLIEYYSKIGDSGHLQDAIHATALAGTQAGRTVQAMALLNHMTPQGQVVWLERSINKANTELQQKFRNKKNIPQFELTQEMTDKVLNAEGKEAMFEALDEVYDELGQQVPKTNIEKIDEWRYFSMLANIKTHGRNMIGNFAMNLTQRTKNKVAGAIEGTVAKFNPKMERTHTIVPTSRKVKQFAKNDVKNMDVQTELGMNENKYNPQSRLQSSRRTFKSDILENTLGKMFDLNSNLLEVEDNIGLKSMYVNSLGEYITANKIDIDNITDAQLSKARQHAIKEAQEATFHQASALATALNQMGRKNNITKFALDSAIPFKKTPINVAKTGVQYSPVGLIKSAVYDVGKLRKGDITVNQYIDNVSKGLTGTGIAYMGYVLAESGILKASGSDDDKKEKYEEEQGKQSYSIEIGGKTYSLDWLSPVGIPLFIGAEINQQYKNKKEEKSSKSSDDNETLNQIVKSVANISNASANAMNPMSEMSMISGLTSVLSSYNKENAVGDMIVNTGKSYINQFVPTALGQLARTTDDYERTTKSTKTGTLEKAVDSTINQVKSKIPGLRQTLPTKTDIWGKNIKQSENLPFRAFNNFINPSKVQDVSTDKVDKELNNLYAKTGNSSIIPKAIDKTLTINSEKYRMTNEEYARYYKKYGDTSYNLIKELISSSEYKDLTNEQKQIAIEKIYSYAKESNKIDYAKKNKINIEENSTVYNTLEELKDKKSQSDYLNYIAKTSDIEGQDANKKKISLLSNSNYSNNTKNIIYKNTLGKNDKTFDSLNKITNININAYLDYKVQDIKGDEDTSSNVQGKTVSGSKKQKVLEYLKNSSLSTVERMYIFGTSYKLDSQGREILQNAINNSSLTKNEKIEIYERLTANIEKYKDGTYHWK